MDKNKNKSRSALRLVWDSARCQLNVGDIQITAALEGFPPFSVDAMVVEQDTSLIMGEAQAIKESEKPAWYLANVLDREQAEVPGTVLVRGQDPLQLLAIVHDIESDPTWQEAWIASALEGVFDEVEQRGIKSLGLPILGTRHGGFKPERFIDLLQLVFGTDVPDHLERLWIILPEGSGCEVLDGLKKIIKSR